MKKQILGLMLLGAMTATADLPSGYRAIDYIESTGAQYLDTGYVPGPTTRFDADMQFVGERRVDAEISKWFGAQEGTVSLACNFGADMSQTNTLFFWVNNTSAGGGSHQVGVIADRQARSRFTLDAASGEVHYGETTIHCAAKTTTHSSHSLYLFGNHMSDGSARMLDCYGMRVYGWKIYDGETLVRDYVPARRVSDDKAGLYDLVNNTFAVSSGPADFATRGSPVVESACTSRPKA